MFERSDFASWLEGPPRDPNIGHRGQRLGLPEYGPGSLAPTGRRLGALVVDGLLSQLIAMGVLGYQQGQGGIGTFKPLLVVFVVNAVLVGTSGTTIGHRLFRLRVERCPQGWAGPVRALVRSVLLCLAVPPMIVDRDGRGLHDRLAGTIIVRT